MAEGTVMVCLANSRKHSGRCIAGIVTEGSQSGEWLRPVSDRHGAEVSESERQYVDGSDPRVLDVLEVPLLRQAPHGHQVENWLLDPHQHWVRRDRLTWGDLARLGDTERLLWPSHAESTYNGLNDRVTAAEAGAFDHSLHLVWVDDLVVRVFAPGAEFGNLKRRVQGQFMHLGAEYRVWIIDPVVERAFLARDDGHYAIGDCYLTMSLGEANDDGFCYKLVAAVITRERTEEGS